MERFSRSCAHTPNQRPTRCAPSPLRRRMSAFADGRGEGWDGGCCSAIVSKVALLRARASVDALPPIQLRLGSLCSPSLRNLPPQGGKRSLNGSREVTLHPHNQPATVPAPCARSVGWRG